MTDKQLEEIQKSMSPEAFQVFTVITDSIMNEFKYPNEVEAKSIFEGLQAAIKVAKLAMNNERAN